MSMIALVMREANASRADVLRVARHGGTTAADWTIAHAIEQVTGRRAADVMWGPTHVPGTETAPPPANPHAVHEPETTVYAEDTAGRLTEADDAEQQLREAAAELAAQVHADLAAVLDDNTAAAALTAAWSTPAEGRALLRWVLELHPRTRRRALSRATAHTLAA